MRLEEYEAKYALVYAPGDILSMKKALADYTQLILDGKAFENSYCVAHFQHACDRIGLNYFEDYPDLIRYLKEVSYYYYADSDPENVQDSTTGETLFFLCAMMHPELEEDIKTACEAIVQFARKENDSSEMWLTCEHPFGVEPLYITAMTYPKYGYLLASYFVPYWDDEHMPEPLGALGQWANDLGITKDTIKAYCYCDNSKARENMLGYDTWDAGLEEGEKLESDFDLLGHFRQYPEGYDYFIEALVERYEAMPYLQTYGDDERYYVENPITSLLVDMLYVHYPYDTWQDDFDIDEYLTHKFIDTNADEAIEFIKNAVEDKLGRPIVPSFQAFLEEKKRQERFKKSIVKTSETDKWSELITKVFENGVELWDYVQTGERVEALDQIVEIDLVNEAKHHECNLADALEAAVRFSDLSEYIYEVIRDYVNERKVRDHHSNNRVAKGEVLRLFDILHRAMGTPYLHSNTIELLDDKNNFLTEEELYERYSTHWKKEIESLIMEVEDTYSYDENHYRIFQRFYTLLNKNRTEAVEHMASWFELKKTVDEGLNESDDFFLTLENKSISSTGYALAGMYILYRDNLQHINDEVTKYAKAYIEAFIPDYVMECLSNHGQWPKWREVKWANEKSFDDEYRQKRQKEVLEGYELWHPVETYLKTGRFKAYSLSKSPEQALAYFKAHLEVEEDVIGENQAKYELFCSSRDENKILFKLALWGGNQENLVCGNLLNRTLKLALHSAPMRVINYLDGVLPGLQESDCLDELIDALDLLKERGLPEPAYWMYQLTHLNKEIDYNLSCCDMKHVQHYVRLMKLYFDDIDLEANQMTPLELMYPEIKRIQGLIREGGKLIPKGELANIILNAPKVLGFNHRYRDLLDQMVIEKIMRSLENQLPEAESPDHKTLWMSCFKQFIDYKLSFDHIKDLLKSTIREYNFLSGGYYDVNLEDIIMEISPKVKNRIVHIISAVDYKKLDLVDEDNLEEYVEFMFSAKVDRESIFKLLVYLEEEKLIEKLALKTDCSIFIKSLSIENQMMVLPVVAQHPQYHPLIVELENHSSLKLKKCVDTLIGAHRIKMNEEVTYHLVDYGVYAMGDLAADADNGDAKKTANEPVCIDQRDEFIGRKGMYFGLRFTVDDPKIAPKVCFHKVVVTHPFRNDEGQIVRIQSSWEQNGYSASNIFLGWYFDENEEMLEGDYHFVAYDTDGILMVEKMLHITL